MSSADKKKYQDMADVAAANYRKESGVLEEAKPIKRPYCRHRSYCHIEEERLESQRLQRQMALEQMQALERSLGNPALTTEQRVELQRLHRQAASQRQQLLELKQAVRKSSPHNNPALTDEEQLELQRLQQQAASERLQALEHKQAASEQPLLSPALTDEEQLELQRLRQCHLQALEHKQVMRDRSNRFPALTNEEQLELQRLQQWASEQLQALEHKQAASEQSLLSPALTDEEQLELQRLQQRAFERQVDQLLGNHHKTWRENDWNNTAEEWLTQFSFARPFLPVHTWDLLATYIQGEQRCPALLSMIKSVLWEVDRSFNFDGASTVDLRLDVELPTAKELEEMRVELHKTLEALVGVSDPIVATPLFDTTQIMKNRVLSHVKMRAKTFETILSSVCDPLAKEYMRIFVVNEALGEYMNLQRARPRFACAHGHNCLGGSVRELLPCELEFDQVIQCVDYCKTVRVGCALSKEPPKLSLRWLLKINFGFSGDAYGLCCAPCGKGMGQACYTPAMVVWLTDHAFVSLDMQTKARLARYVNLRVQMARARVRATQAQKQCDKLGSYYADVFAGQSGATLGPRRDEQLPASAPSCAKEIFRLRLNIVEADREHASIYTSTEYTGYQRLQSTPWHSPPTGPASQEERLPETTTTQAAPEPIDPPLLALTEEDVSLLPLTFDETPAQVRHFVNLNTVTHPAKRQCTQRMEAV